MSVAVIMPTRNQAAYLEAAVDSVMSQALPGLRLWVQDGASTDGTPALLAELARRHPGLGWASEADGGPAEALNRALARVLADPAVEIVGWLNSDDLYAPGALARAVAHLAAHPEQVAVYGEGEHLDAAGRPIGRYPTGRPDLPLAAWADGCPICQPTMVLRREALEALGPLDTTLKTAFDFDLWLRLFRRFPGRIGQLDAVQAYSRLHSEGITLSQRRAVMLESIAVIHRHIGPAPAHWLATCALELMQTWPDGQADAPRLRLAELMAEARPHLRPEELPALLQHWRSHQALELGRPDAWLALEPDGWLGAEAALRLRPARDGTLQITGRFPRHTREPLTLQAEGPQGERPSLTVPPGSVFTWRWPVPASPTLTQHWRIHAGPVFVPSQIDPGSSDHRQLACQITGLRWLA